MDLSPTTVDGDEEDAQGRHGLEVSKKKERTSDSATSTNAGWRVEKEDDDLCAWTTDLQTPKKSRDQPKDVNGTASGRQPEPNGGVSYPELVSTRRLDHVEDFHYAMHASLSQPAGDELADFIATEMEQQHARTAAVANGLRRLERIVAASSCDVAALAKEQRDKSSQHVAFMRRLEAEVALGADLRSEEAQLRDGKVEMSLRTLRRDVESSLKAFERAQETRLREMEEKMDRVVVDVVVENQTLKAENMELRVVLQQVAAAANSNKKTLRVLTDEILKLKRQVALASSSAGLDSASDRLERGIALALRVAASDSSSQC